MTAAGEQLAAEGTSTKRDWLEAGAAVGAAGGAGHAPFHGDCVISALFIVTLVLDVGVFPPETLRTVSRVHSEEELHQSATDSQGHARTLIAGCMVIWT
ncbi:hypothetical protein JOB18_042021 [Solea senegalensis]|uniref:Uncharacterized protein n=1 Tax=Solea senegalensis TaxID=28829 RepID=A0AAV6QHY5_SOLSE|nr:hypothetical protein JOB18_042021 [Solea senegalensis]